jgi:hypothetical protein
MGSGLHQQSDKQFRPRHKPWSLGGQHEHLWLLGVGCFEGERLTGHWLLRPARWYGRKLSFDVCEEAVPLLAAICGVASHARFQSQRGPYTGYVNERSVNAKSQGATR